MTPAQYTLWAYWWEHGTGWTAYQWERWLWRGYGVRRVVQLTDTQAHAALVRLREVLA